MERDPQALLSRTAADEATLASLVATVPAERWSAVTDGEWTARQILIHLADTEIVFGYRMRVALAEPGNSITSFDQDRWVAELPYDHVPLQSLADLYTSNRRANVALLSVLPENAWQREVIHPVNGPVTLQQICNIFVPHGSEHISQLEAMLTNA